MAGPTGLVGRGNRPGSGGGGGRGEEEPGKGDGEDNEWARAGSGVSRGKDVKPEVLEG